VSDMRELYQEVILDHNKHPRNYGPLDDADLTAQGHNPLCGDNITIHMKVDDGIVQDVHFEGAGCAIVTASASLMTDALKGKTVDEAEMLFEQMMDLITGESDEPPDGEGLGKLAVFAGVRDYPTRVKCATLAWHTLHAALHDQTEASTE
jgi:nitrogen fixation NifU-like protein